MRANELKSRLGIGQLVSLLVSLGANPIDAGNHYECETICHGGDSHKLYLYKDTGGLVCYTNCGSMDIIELVSKVMDFDFISSLRYIQDFFDIHDDGSTFERSEIDLPVIKTYQKPELKHIPAVDDNVMYHYYDNLFYQDWIDEGISIETMLKYKISLSIEDHQIIIPHFNVDGELVGIRSRNFDKEELDRGRKYVPVYKDGKLYNYPTGMNMFGLNFTKEYINKVHKIIFFEAEKSVMMMDSIYHDNSVAVALNGSALTPNHIALLETLDVDEVIVAFDKEFHESGTDESKFYANKIKHTFGRLKNLYNVSVLWDKKGLLDYKDSPVDKGRHVFETLYKARISVY